MKKNLLLLFSCGFILLRAQQPAIGTTTIIPQNPTSNDFIKIVTNITTPNQSFIVDVSFTVTGQQIRLKNCYAQGMLPATQTHIDTFMIGYLPFGNYQIVHKAYLSSAGQWCNPVDSNFASAPLVVSGFTGIDEHSLNGTLSIYPNPANSTLSFRGPALSGEAFIFSGSGALVKKAALMPGASVNISDLAEGLYFIRVKNEEKVLSTKFVKVRLE
jgi:hypothetical protein